MSIVAACGKRQPGVSRQVSRQAAVGERQRQGRRAPVLVDTMVGGPETCPSPKGP